MDLDAAVGAHAQWKMRLRKAIDDKATLDAATIKRDNCCDLGKWLHGQGKAAHGSLESHGACLRQHAAFHAEAGKVADVINAGDFDKALGMIGSGSAYTQASSSTGVAIMRLKKDVAR